MEIILYTLPTCGICKIIEQKMLKKNISFKIKPFEEIMDTIHSDHAPALKIINNDNEIIYNTPTQINEWVNNF